MTKPHSSASRPNSSTPGRGGDEFRLRRNFEVRTENYEGLSRSAGSPSTGERQSVDALSEREARANGADDRGPASQAKQTPKAIDGLDPGAVRPQEVLEAELAQLACGPSELGISGCEEMKTSDRC